MRKLKVSKIWITAFLLVVVVAGCGDSDRGGGPTSPTTAPTVVAVAPLDASTGICSNAVVTAVFSKAMNPATIMSPATTFTLTGPGTTNVAGNVTYDMNTDTATFTPMSPLGLNIQYTATISTGAQDQFGNGLAVKRTWSFTTSATACNATPPPLACGFGILAGSTVTNTGPTIITGGDLGLSPGTAVTGFPPGTLVPPAAMHVADSTAAQGQLALTAAYNFAAGQAATGVLPGDLSGLTFTAGVYKNSSTVMISAGNFTVTGSATDVFIFQIGSTLTTGSGTQVVLGGSALAKNVYWQVGSSATLGTTSIFKGNIMALTSVTLTTGANLEGRALARNGAVTLDNNIVTVPSCP
jgi:hypothetical protein